MARPKKTDERKTLLRRLQKATNEVPVPKQFRRTKTVLFQEQIHSQSRIIGIQNDKIKQLCDLIDDTKAKLAAAQREIEEYCFTIRVVRRATQHLDLQEHQQTPPVMGIMGVNKPHSGEQQ